MNPYFPIELDITANASRENSSESPPPLHSSMQRLSLVSPRASYPSQTSPIHAHSGHSSIDGQAVPGSHTESPLTSSYSSALSSSRASEYTLHLHQSNDGLHPAQLDLTSSTMSPRQRIAERYRLPDSVEFETISRCCPSRRSICVQPNQQRLSYVSDRHPKNSLEAMNNLRKNKDLCDVSLLVGAKRINAHRLVLAASSPYFKAMFTGEMAEAKQSEVNFTAFLYFTHFSPNCTFFPIFRLSSLIWIHKPWRLW